MNEIVHELVSGKRFGDGDLDRRKDKALCGLTVGELWSNGGIVRERDDNRYCQPFAKVVSCPGCLKAINEREYAKRPVLFTPPPPPLGPPKADENGFKKADTGKLRMGLIPPHFLEALALCMTKGAEKYGAGNYLKGADWSRYYDAAQRHMTAWAKGENLDNGPGGTGTNHLINAVACLLILSESQRLNVGKDDRSLVTTPPPPAPTPGKVEVVMGLAFAPESDGLERIIASLAPPRVSPSSPPPYPGPRGFERPVVKRPIFASGPAKPLAELVKAEAKIHEENKPRRVPNPKYNNGVPTCRLEDNAACNTCFMDAPPAVVKPKRERPVHASKNSREVWCGLANTKRIKTVCLWPSTTCKKCRKAGRVDGSLR